VVALGRRYFVGGAAALGTTALWPSRPSHAATAMGFDEARHLLSRATFGATPAEIQAVAAMDYEAAVDRLLATWHGDALTALPDGLNKSPEDQARALCNWWVEEMLATNQPLVERMTLFWHNHFTSSLQLLALFDGAHDRCNAYRDVFLCRGPGANADSHCELTSPSGRAAPAGTIFLNGFHALLCLGVTSERNKHLVENHIVQNCVPSCGKLSCKPCRVLTTAFDHLRYATSSERLDRSPNFDPARPVRHVRTPLYRFASFP